MNNRLIAIRALWCAGAVAAVTLGFSWLETVMLADSGPAAAEGVDPSLVFHGLAVVAAGLAAFAVSFAWQLRFSRRVDSLVETCRQLALGEPTNLTDGAGRLDELGRLSLAIQFMHAALVDYLSLYRRFFDGAPDMFLSLAPSGGNILDANQAFCRTVGLLKSEVLGRPVEKYVTLDQGWNLSLERGEALQAGQMRTDRGIIKIEASISLERGPEGQPWVVGAMLRDVSQREALHHELLTKSTALEKALVEIRNVEELKDQFLTTLSHELKTPLVSLKGFLQLIMQQRVAEQDRQGYLDICWRNLGKLEKQINNLLDLARLSHAKEQFEMAPVDLAGLVRTEADNLKGLAAEKRISLDLTRVPPGSVMVWGNAEKLMQLVDNLLLNAVKYNVEDGRVRVALDQGEREVVLSVSDSGVGIARENMANIFNRFYQADISGTGRLEGLGIGLSLVQEIVLLHKGDIRVYSEPGAGTTFTVTLEAAP